MLEKTYNMHKDAFAALNSGTYDFDFLEVQDQPVAITKIKDHTDPDKLVLSIEPIYQVPSHFPISITVTSGFSLLDVFVINDTKSILKFLKHSLQRKIGTANTSKREDRLLSAYISALSNELKD